jgi:hypothetical protein
VGIGHESPFDGDGQGARTFHLVYGFGFEAGTPLTVFSDGAHVRNLLRKNVERHDFASLALDGNFERATTDFAISGETLVANGGVEFQLEATSAEGALDLFG